MPWTRLLLNTDTQTAIPVSLDAHLSADDITFFGRAPLPALRLPLVSAGSYTWPRSLPGQVWHATACLFSSSTAHSPSPSFHVAPPATCRGASHSWPQGILRGTAVPYPMLPYSSVQFTHCVNYITQTASSLTYHAMSIWYFISLMGCWSVLHEDDELGQALRRDQVWWSLSCE